MAHKLELLMKTFDEIYPGTGPMFEFRGPVSRKRRAPAPRIASALRTAHITLCTSLGRTEDDGEDFGVPVVCAARSAGPSRRRGSRARCAQNGSRRFSTGVPSPRRPRASVPRPDHAGDYAPLRLQLCRLHVRRGGVSQPARHCARRTCRVAGARRRGEEGKRRSRFSRRGSLSRVRPAREHRRGGDAHHGPPRGRHPHALRPVQVSCNCRRGSEAVLQGCCCTRSCDARCPRLVWLGI